MIDVSPAGHEESNQRFEVHRFISTRVYRFTDLLKYRKISNISPGLIFDFGTFFWAYIRGGLYSRGTIFEGFFLLGIYFLFGDYFQNSHFFSPFSKIFVG